MPFLRPARSGPADVRRLDTERAGGCLRHRCEVVRRLQHSYMDWDVLPQEWKAVLVQMEAGELGSSPERRAALVTPLQLAEESTRAASRGIPWSRRSCSRCQRSRTSSGVSMEASV